MYLWKSLIRGSIIKCYCPTFQRDYREITSHRPEVILNNFTTRLGHTVGRMLAALFHYEPQFHGKRVVTFHNQRDYIFFRHHRLVKHPSTHSKEPTVLIALFPSQIRLQESREGETSRTWSKIHPQTSFSSKGNL